MDLLHRAMVYYPFVFHPITVLGAGIATIVYYEWAQQDAGKAALRRRIGAFLAVGLLAIVPTAAYFLLRGGLSGALEGSSWWMDMLVASGLFIAAGATWYVWRRFDWGALVPDAMVVLAAVTVPYAVLSPYWDISGHVIIALMPTLYLALVDRTFWPLLAIPVIMIPNRVYLDAHSWTQSIVGFLAGAAIVLGFYLLRTRRRSRRVRGSTTP